MENFCYLANMLCTNGKVHDIKVCAIRVEWNKFKWCLVFCMNGAVSQDEICERSAVFCEPERYAIRVEEINRLHKIEMRVIHVIHGKTLEDKIRNECI